MSLETTLLFVAAALSGTIVIGANRIAQAVARLAVSNRSGEKQDLEPQLIRIGDELDRLVDRHERQTPIFVDNNYDANTTKDVYWLRINPTWPPKDELGSNQYDWNERDQLLQQGYIVVRMLVEPDGAIVLWMVRQAAV